jgi:hydrogenase/urease accessory protein HupE
MKTKYKFLISITSIFLLSQLIAAHPLDLQKVSAFEVGWVYLKLGFEHILPVGLDHILFIVGLFLLSPKLKPLLAQITCFTIAHSITLALSMYNIFSLPSNIIEPVIALSIIFIAIENILTTKLHSWRLIIVFLFGLVHGMGFAGALKELGLPKTQFLNALITFNLGVELGQITAVLICFLLVGLWFKSTKWYHKRIVIPASALIGIIALYWTIERTFF